MKKNIIVLTLITIISGFLLGTVYEVTKEPIVKAKEDAKQVSFQEIFPEATEFGEVAGLNTSEANEVLSSLGYEGIEILEMVEVKKDADSIGYILSLNTPEGYAGDIGLVMGITIDGVVTGISFLEIAETAGLGMKATEPEFKDQFKNQDSEQFHVSKSGEGDSGAIDSISGATITSEAITNCVNAGIAFYHEELGGDIDGK